MNPYFNIVIYYIFLDIEQWIILAHTFTVCKQDLKISPTKQQIGP